MDQRTSCGNLSPPPVISEVSTPAEEAAQPPPQDWNGLCVRLIALICPSQSPPSPVPRPHIHVPKNDRSSRPSFSPPLPYRDLSSPSHLSVLMSLFHSDHQSAGVSGLSTLLTDTLPHKGRQFSPGVKPLLAVI